MYSKLDRIMASVSWFSTFPHVEAEFMDPILSDHTPMFVDIKK